jgi:histidinol-phosphatase
MANSGSTRSSACSKRSADQPKAEPTRRYHGQVTEYSPADDLSLALALASNADLISQDRFHALDLVVTNKPDNTPVTDADQAVERSIRSGIEAARPTDSILGEEYGTSGASDRQWIIDPIDGTANYLRGVPIWGTLIALAVDGVPLVGVASSPALGKRWWAAKGHGAWRSSHGAEPTRLAVSGISELADATLSYNSIKGWDKAGRLDHLVSLSRAVGRARAIGDMWSYMLLAEGALDIVAEFDLKPFDIAALIPIVEEAGGRFTSIEGGDGPWGGSALATNGVLHGVVLGSLGSGA